MLWFKHVVLSTNNMVDKMDNYKVGQFLYIQTGSNTRDIVRVIAIKCFEKHVLYCLMSIDPGPVENPTPEVYALCPGEFECLWRDEDPCVGSIYKIEYLNQIWNGYFSP